MTIQRRQEIHDLLESAWHDLYKAGRLLADEGDSLQALVNGAADQVCDAQLSVAEDLPAPEDEDPAAALPTDAPAPAVSPTPTAARSTTHLFPCSFINTVHQTGEALTEPVAGVTVELHWRAGEDLPCCAEVFATDPNSDEYAEVGLMWDVESAPEATLDGYDGVFSLPHVVAAALRIEGFIVPEDME